MTSRTRSGLTPHKPSVRWLRLATSDSLLLDHREVAFGVEAVLPLLDFVQPPPRAGEPVFPFLLANDEQELRLGSLRELIPSLRKLGEKGMRITRFKGLGEMDSEELWSTTMNPEARRLLQVTMEDAAAADEIFRVLMGDHVEPRRDFIEKHALEVRNLDV